MILNIGILIVLIFWGSVIAGSIYKERKELSQDTAGSFAFFLFIESLLFIAILYFIQRILG